MTAATNPNPNMPGIDGYDDSGHQVVKLRAKNVTTDTSVTPNVTVGDLGIEVEVTVQNGTDTFGNATNITSATTFSGVPTISQLVASSFVLLANPGDQATFLAQISATAFVERVLIPCVEESSQ